LFPVVCRELLGLQEKDVFVRSSELPSVVVIMQRQPPVEETETDATYLRWVAEAEGNITQAARNHTTTERDLEPLRKRVQGAVNRQRSGLQPVPPNQQTTRRKHSIPAQVFRDFTKKY
jgi:hypothetical protein